MSEHRLPSLARRHPDGSIELMAGYRRFDEPQPEVLEIPRETPQRLIPTIEISHDTPFPPHVGPLLPVRVKFRGPCVEALVGLLDGLIAESRLAPIPSSITCPHCTAQMTRSRFRDHWGGPYCVALGWRRSLERAGWVPAVEWGPLLAALGVPTVLAATLDDGSGRYGRERWSLAGAVGTCEQISVGHMFTQAEIAGRSTLACAPHVPLPPELFRQALLPYRGQRLAPGRPRLGRIDPLALEVVTRAKRLATRLYPRRHPVRATLDLIDEHLFEHAVTGHGLVHAWGKLSQKEARQELRNAVRCILDVFKDPQYAEQSWLAARSFVQVAEDELKHELVSPEHLLEQPGEATNASGYED